MKALKQNAKSALFILGLSSLILGALLYVWSRANPPFDAATLNSVGLEVIRLGALLSASFWLVLPVPEWLARGARNKYLVWLVACGVLVAFWLPVALVGHSAVIANQRYWWLVDDAMISMRYARNLANGVGLVWNAGEHVEGYSNFLWTLYMAFIHRLPLPDSQTSLAVLLTNIVISLATLPLLYNLMCELGGNTVATIAALAAFVLSADAMAWATEGVETPLLTLLTVYCVYRVLREAREQFPRVTTFVLIGVLAWVRADALILVILIDALAFVLNRAKKQVIIYSFVGWLLPLAQEIFRIVYYGDLLPNTAYLKVFNWDTRYLAGFHYLGSFALRYVAVILLAAWGAFKSRRQILMTLFVILAAYAAFIAYEGGDSFDHFRFFVPVLPLWVALAVLAIQIIFSRALRQRFVTLGLLVTVPLFVWGGYTSFLQPAANDVGNIRIGLLLEQNTPRTAKVADYWAGAVFYFSQRYGVDLLGKMDRHIARLVAYPGAMLPGHNKFDFDYSLTTYKPDYAIGSVKLPADERALLRVSEGNNAFYGQYYFSRVFQEHCLPNPINVDTWRTIFVCDWSSEKNATRVWEK